MGKPATTSSLPTRTSARPRRQRSSAADTITVKQKMSAITISDSSDPVIPTNTETVDDSQAGSNRPWGRKGKAPIQAQRAVASQDNDSSSDIEEYDFRDEDWDMGTDEDDAFSDNQSVISVESSSDDDNSEFALSDRPWVQFPPSVRKQWELMYCMVCMHPVHDNWEVTELYQLDKDNEMLRYMEDFPLPQWLVPQDEALQAYQRLTERRRWRNLGIPIYGQHPTGREPFHISQGRLPQEPPRPLPSQRRSQDIPQAAQAVAPQQVLQSQNIPRPSIEQQRPVQQSTPQQTQQTPIPLHNIAQPNNHQQNGPPSNGPPQSAAQENKQQQGIPQPDVPQQTGPQQTIPEQNTSQTPHSVPQNTPQAALTNMQAPPPGAGVPPPGIPPPGMQYPPMHPGMQGMPPQPGMCYPPPGMQWPYPQYAQPHPQHQGQPMPPYQFPPNAYGHPGMGYPAGPQAASYSHYQPQSAYKYSEPPKRRVRKETPPPQSPPPPPQTPPYAARKRPIEKKPGNKPGRKSTRKHAEAEEFPWTRKLDFNAEKAKATWDLGVYDTQTLEDMAATRNKNIAVIEDIDAKIQEQQRKRLQEKNALAKLTDHAAGIARAAKKAKEKAGNPSEIDGKKVRQKREGRPKGDVGGDPYHSGVFAFATPADEERAAHLGFASPDEVIDNAEEGNVEPAVQASIKIYWDPGKKGMTENLEQAKFSVRDTVVTRKQLENTPILTKVAAECIVDFCPDLLWRSMLLRITSEAGCGNKDVRDRFCHNGCYCDKATITKRISAALGQKQTQPKSKGYQPGEWEWYDENVKDFSKYIDYFGMRTSHRNMLKIQMAGEKRKRDTHTNGDAAADLKEDVNNNHQEDKRQKLDDDDADVVVVADAPPKKAEVDVQVEAEAEVETNGQNDVDVGNESAEESDDSNAVSLQDSDVLDKMED